jgi:hypothetical protein
MYLSNFLEATLKLGVPMVILSWLIFTWLYGRGELDRKTDRKTIDAQVKKIRKSYKKREKSKKDNYLIEKWMWFGSGFYGLAGLWTFVVIEVADIFRILFEPSLIIHSLDDGVIAAVVNVFLNQLGNVISAFVWFSYWADDGMLVWMLAAYAGYWAGVELARRSEDLTLQDWLQKLKSFLP